MLGEVRRPVNGYHNPSDPFPAAFPPPPSRSPQQSFVYGAEMISPLLIIGVKMNSVSGEITFPQVVYRRKRRQDEKETD